jgi:hypothetical protein
MDSTVALILGILGTVAFFFFRKPNPSETERALGKEEGLREVVEKAQADLRAGAERVRLEREAKEKAAKSATPDQVEDFYEKNLNNSSNSSSGSNVP